VCLVKHPFKCEANGSHHACRLSPATFWGAFKALYHYYARGKSRLKLDMDGWIHALPLRESRHDGENDGSIVYTREKLSTGMVMPKPNSGQRERARPYRECQQPESIITSWSLGEKNCRMACDSHMRASAIRGHPAPFSRECISLARARCHGRCASFMSRTRKIEVTLANVCST
jgi:hypothetical protein